MALHKTPSRKRKRLLAGMVAGVMAAGAAIGVATASAHGGFYPTGGGSDRGNDRSDRDRDRDRDDREPGEDPLAPPSEDFYVDIQDVEPNAEDLELQASPGTFVTQCGRNEEQHLNSANVVISPGVFNGAQHVHDYVGNLTTTEKSDNRSLSVGDTTCRFGDRSTYYWPVVRELGLQGADRNEPGGAVDGNVGKVLTPAEVTVEFRGNAEDRVSPMPRFLRGVTGDAKAVTNGDDNVNARWTCTGFEDRRTTQYPICPEGSQLMRILDFPSCWDGENTDSDNHRDHLRFVERDGECPRGTRAVPQLRYTLVYDTPNEVQGFALDSFPEQAHNPKTDHAAFINVMPRRLMNFAVRCINSGRSC
ncbi:DUF1996 domain-containing protein [Amycolatopsis cihanbeyliensis]|uniref:Uncharacterized protein DUF1996 n=1 Tax=Amycolatopsis cihanbeyliensis TaxID=1128664 RepID=A0A542DR87_AMYCI|nr:DUF1996 domain-containing protein [Amycolatopsis cihanbeyliensis]TQJ05514.1 uncharacterized protein DUF1996 [Amycolatopsis cihanbeyliensis]